MSSKDWPSLNGTSTVETKRPQFPAHLIHNGCGVDNVCMTYNIIAIHENNLLHVHINVTHTYIFNVFFCV